MGTLTILLLISWKWISQTLSTTLSLSNVTNANPARTTENSEISLGQRAQSWSFTLLNRCSTVTMTTRWEGDDNTVTGTKRVYCLLQAYVNVSLCPHKNWTQLTRNQCNATQICVMVNSKLHVALASFLSNFRYLEISSPAKARHVTERRIALQNAASYIQR